eukprot:TRINITY_DN50_c0_g1_i1.p1 TRINITY_DN50_c0_g1~~TRINITY_DN50_c0_g1_i1.p1  ORF type:complete len:755 (-),score=49.43 TRINITY_DN50_c0_g1_i1:686-2950(-)
MNDLNGWKMLNWDMEGAFIDFIVLMYNYVVAKAKNLLNALRLVLLDMCSCDLLFEDGESLVEHLERLAQSLIARFAIVWYVLRFLLLMEKPNIWDRVVFILTIAYSASRYFLSRKLTSLAILRHLVLVEITIYTISYNISYYNSPTDCIVTNTAAMLVISLMSRCYITTALLGLMVSILNTIVLYRVTSRESQLLKLYLVYALIVAITKTREKWVLGFLRSFKQSKKHTQNEINTTMFVASVSHDLKNPLSSILGCIDQLKSSPNVTQSEKQSLLTASYSVQLLLYLIGNIHDISKISCGKFEIDRYPMEISKEVRKVCKIEKELAKLKGIKFYKKVVKPLPRFVYGDPMRFEQILINLLGNSIKFTRKGYVGVLLNWVENLDEIQDEVGFIPPEDFFTQKSFHMSKANIESEQELDILNETMEQIECGAINNRMLKYKIGCPGSIHSKANSEANLMTQPDNFVNVTQKEKAKADSAIPKAFIMYGNKKTNDEDKEESESDNESNVLQTFLHKDSGLLVVDIIDTGIGMTSEGIQKLFQPFIQATKGVRKRFGGTGLGLWITKQLVNSMSGFIEVKSEPKKGSRFRIAIPFSVCSKRLSRSNSSELYGIKVSPSSHSSSANEFRNANKTAFKGRGDLLKGMKLLILEDDSFLNDRKLEQLCKLLQRDTCELTYSPYNNAAERLELSENYFDGLIVIASTVTVRTKTIISQTLKFMIDRTVRPTPLCVATGNSYHNTKKQQTLQHRESLWSQQSS